MFVEGDHRKKSVENKSSKGTQQVEGKTIVETFKVSNNEHQQKPKSLPTPSPNKSLQTKLQYNLISHIKLETGEEQQEAWDWS